MAEGNEPRPYGIRDVSAQITVDSNLVTVDSLYCYIVGNICICNIRLKSKANLYNPVTILSNLPASIITMKIPFYKVQGVTEPGVIGSSGNLRTDYSNINTNDEFFISAAYPTND